MKKPKFLKTTFTTYSMIRVIGQGGNGYVYKAKDNDNTIVAIKILDPAKASEEKLKRFENEYRFSATNTHPNIIRVIDHGLTDEDTPFFVMPIYDGSIRDLIKKVNPVQAFNVIKKILDGVEAAHQRGVIHRDLKPENILFSKDGEDIVITDFGIASFGEEDLFTAVETQNSTRLANFQYAAPEQRVRGGIVTEASDFYALGLIINELFTGHIPLGKGHETIGSKHPDYEYMDIVVDRMLQQDARNRYQSIDEAKKEISARGKEQLVRQKMSKLKNKVIPKTELDDPIIQDPMKIVNVDWEGDNLRITLNHVANDTWQWSFQHIGNYSSVYGKGPDAFQFYGNDAVISAQSHEAKEILGFFKQWLPQANTIYKQQLKLKAELKEREEIEKIKKEIELQEVRKKVIDELRF